MSDTLQPWYKQFWPWFLIILPMCAVVASFATLFIAIDNSDSLVAQEYYKDGKAINMDLAKETYAKQIGMNFLLSVNKKQLQITQEGGPEYLAGLSVKFYHPTIEEKDFSLLATADANKIYRINLENDIAGTWEVRLESYDSKWRIHRKLKLINNQQYMLN